MDLLESLAETLCSLPLSHPVRVAIDGPDGAGKTTLANELRLPIERRGRQVIRASIDGFHRPRVERYRRGALSPDGYYLDSFDYDAIRTHLLMPLGPGGDLRYRSAVFDVHTDSPRREPLKVAAADAVLLVDGVFLLRPELNDCWDFRFFVRVEHEELLPRVVRRDTGLLGSAEAVKERYHERYIPGQQIYFDAVRPWSIADVVIDN